MVLGLDHILERDDSIYIAEEVIEQMAPESIVTLAHQPGQVLGPLEQYKIQSTMFSNMSLYFADLLKKPFLLFSAAKSLNVCCSNDLYINISSGFSHAASICDGVRKITYLVDNILGQRPQTLTQKVFWPYLRSRFTKSLASSEEIWVVSDELKQWLPENFNGKVKVVRPTFQNLDYPCLPAAHFKKQTLMVEVTYLNKVEVIKYARILQDQRLDFRFIGRDEHLTDLKKELGEDLFIGWKCAGELAPILNSARALIMPKFHFYPSMALCSLSCGLPVITMEKRGEYLNTDFVYEIGSIEDLQFNEELKKCDQITEQQRKSLSEFAAGFSGNDLLRAMNQIKRKVQKVNYSASPAPSV